MADWLSKIDLSEQTYLSNIDKEPKGDIQPYRQKKITSAFSLPYHDDNGDFNPSEESRLKDGIDQNSGEWNLSGDDMPQASYDKIKEFFETNPPNDEFIFYRDGAGSFYVEIDDFKGTLDDIWETYKWTMKLKNLGAVV